MAINLVKTNFSSGALSPLMYGRVDNKHYYNGVEVLRNYVCLPQGGITRCPGTRVVQPAKYDDKKVRLIPFQFSTIQAYSLEFGHKYIRFFYKGAGRIETDRSTVADFDPTTSYNTGDVSQHGDYIAIDCGNGRYIYFSKPETAPAPPGIESNKTVEIETNTVDTLVITQETGTGGAGNKVLIKLANATPSKNASDLIQTGIRALGSPYNDWFVTENPFVVVGDITGDGSYLASSVGVGNVADNAFDGDPNTAWLTERYETDGWIQYTSGGKNETIEIDGDYTVHTFTGDATFTPEGDGEIEVLVVAGGGGGATGRRTSGGSRRPGGGGGGGGVVFRENHAVTAQTYDITVGKGGGNNTNGTDSVFDGLVAIGGGGGGGTVGKAGGSGGGGRQGGAGGAGIQPGSATTGFGQNGGASTKADDNRAGGGGGAGGPGTDDTGVAGPGYGYRSKEYSRGGRGRINSPIAGEDGTGQGGDGASTSARPGTRIGAKGGDGVVVIRYLTASLSVAPSQKKITDYRITAPALQNRAPKDWTLQASNTGAFGGEETTLDTQTDEVFTTGQTKSYNFSNTTAYKYYRLVVTLNNGDTDYLAIAKLQMSEDGWVAEISEAAQEIVDGAGSVAETGITEDDNIYRAMQDITPTAGNTSWFPVAEPDFWWDNGEIYEIVTPYGEDDLAELDYSQDADVMYICHPDYKPRKLSRTGHASWTLEEFTPTGDPFTAVTKYPRSSTIFQRRLFFGGTREKPQTIWGSRTGDYENFTTGAEDDHALEFTIGSEQVNAILWLSSGKTLGGGTTGGVFIISGGADEPLTPSNVRAQKDTSVGTSKTKPVPFNTILFYIQSNAKTIREFAYSLEADAHQALDKSVLSSHLTTDGIKEMAFQASPLGIIWIVLNNGECLMLTRQVEHEVTGWSERTTDGKFESVCTLRGDEEDDEIWFAVQREIDGVSRRYIERLMPFDVDNPDSDIEDSFFVDSGIPFEGTGLTEIEDLGHLEGKEVAILTDGAVHAKKTVSSGKVTLDWSADKGCVGLPITSYCRLLRLEPMGAVPQTGQGMRKKIFTAMIRLYKTVGLKVGGVEKLDEINFKPEGYTDGDKIPFFNGDKELLFPGTYDKDGYVIIEHDSCLPSTITSVVRKVDIIT